MASDHDLESYYKSLFVLKQDHNYSLGDVKQMLPFERNLFVEMVNNWVYEKENALKQKINQP